MVQVVIVVVLPAHPKYVPLGHLIYLHQLLIQLFLFLLFILPCILTAETQILNLVLCH